MRGALLAFLLAACGGTGLAKSPSVSGPTQGPDAATESWAWTQSHLHQGSFRIELENWQLHTEADGSVSGWLVRENRFFSTDGEPFACIQALSYSRLARYRLRGTRRAEGLLLEETQVQALPSPCEDGVRPLQSYTGQLQSDGKLRLQWPGGEQLLVPASSQGSPEASAQERSLSGTWSWTARGIENQLERSETEHWQFQELPNQQVRARYQREVRVVDATGADIPCAGRDRYSYQDSYELVGSKHGKRLHLQEASVQAASHPCIDAGRVLDAADITIYPEALVLEWRGRRLQVLKPGRLERPLAPRAWRTAP